MVGGSATFGVLKVEIDLSVPSKRDSTLITPKVAMPNPNGKPNFGGVKRDLELYLLITFQRSLAKRASCSFLRDKTSSSNY